MAERKYVTGEELLLEHQRHCQEIHEDAIAYAKAFETHGESVPSHIIRAYEDGRLAELEYLSTKKKQI